MEKGYFGEDERTIYLLEQIGFDYWNRGEEDLMFENLNHDRIMNLELTHYDSYRLFMFFAVFYDKIKNNFSSDDGMMMIRKVESVFGLMEKSKLWRLEDSQDKFLREHLRPMKIRGELIMPFEHIFLDNSFDIGEDSKIFGMILWEVSGSDRDEDFEVPEDMKPVADKVNEYYRDKLICNILYLRYEKNFGFVFTNSLYDLATGKQCNALFRTELAKKEESDKKIKIEKKIIIGFLTNLLLFLNEPRVVIHHKEVNNNARMKKGKIPVPSLLRTILKTDLRDYIENIYFNESSNNKLDYSFWVRKHKRILSSPRYKNKRGEIIIIPAHIRGKGLMPPQEFIIQ